MSTSASLGMAPTETPETVLQEAHRIIHGPRRATYGHPLKNFSDIAAGWAVILGAPVNVEQVALCMAWLKICRHNHGGDRDSVVDLAGYAGCLDLIADARREASAAPAPPSPAP